jgi:hypothetical protein
MLGTAGGAVLGYAIRWMQNWADTAPVQREDLYDAVRGGEWGK